MTNAHPKTKRIAAVLVGVAALAIAVLLGLYQFGFFAVSPQPAVAAGGTPTPATNPTPTADTATWSVVETHDAWEVQCPSDREDNHSCVASLRFTQQDTGQVVLSWMVIRAEDGSLALAIQSPSGVLLPPGIELTLGAAEVRHIAYASCLPARCTAAVPMDEAFIREMSAAAEARLKIVAANSRALEFSIPVTGFSEAIAVITK